MTDKSEPLTDEELESAAERSTEPSGETDSGREQLLDSGIERIRFSAPEDPPEDASA